MDDKKQRRARNITVFATFLAFMGIGVVDPILPVIAEQIGASHWQVEMLFTAYIFTMAIMMLPSGLLAGKLGDKRVMAIGLAMVTLFALLCGFSDTILQLSLLRAGWGMGNSFFFATAMTLLIALSTETHKAVGLYEAAIGLGMAGGPLVGGLLGGYSWRFPFIATGTFILIAFILVLFFVKQPMKKQDRKIAGFKEMGQLLSYKPFMLCALSGMFYYYGFFVVLAYSPLILGLSAIQLGLVFFGWGICLAYGSAVLAHQLERKYTTRTLIRFGLFAFVVLLFLLFAVDVKGVQIALIIGSGVILGLNNALFTSYVMEMSPYDRGITSGVYNFVRWLGAGIAPIMSGYLGHALFPTAPYAIATVLALIALVIVAVPIKYTQSEKILER